MTALGSVHLPPTDIGQRINGAPKTPASPVGPPENAGLAGPTSAGRGVPPSSPDRQTPYDEDLARAVRRAAWMRQTFYAVVLLVALAGQVSGAVEALSIPLLAAIPAVLALELGGVVVLANADVRRRLGEHALASRVLSAAIAAWAVAFNWLAHDNHLLGGFFAGMSALGYLVWLTHTENQRRDRLRAKGDLPPTTPAYEIVGHWLRHPWLTQRARSLAKADPGLGLYGSLAAARAQVASERRTANVAEVLRRRFRKSKNRAAAELALASLDLAEIGALAIGQLEARIFADLVAEEVRGVSAETATTPAVRKRDRTPTTGESAPTTTAPTGSADRHPASPTTVRSPRPPAGPRTAQRRLAPTPGEGKPFPPVAIRDAAFLRATYGQVDDATLPGRNELMALHGWADPKKASNARRAYLAGADLHIGAHPEGETK